MIEGRRVPRDQITILIGAGLHRAMTRAELERMLGPAIVAGYRIVIHDARDPDGVIFLERYPGKRRGGIYLNAQYMRATVRIVTGFVEPHLFAGFSGGGKGVFPGVASAHNIIRNHGVANLMHPGAGYGVAEGNPVFEEMRRVALHSDVTFLCNVTMNPDKGVTGIYCGDLAQAQDAAIAQVKRQAICPIPHPYNIVVASNGGFPADLNLYQGVKGMVAAAQAVQQGGQIVLAAECREGPGSTDYTSFLHSRETPDALLERMLAPDFHRIDQWQVLEQVLVQRKAAVHLYSAMHAATVRASHLVPVMDVGETVSALARRTPASADRHPASWRCRTASKRSLFWKTQTSRRFDYVLHRNDAIRDQPCRIRFQITRGQLQAKLRVVWQPRLGSREAQPAHRNDVALLACPTLDRVGDCEHVRIAVATVPGWAESAASNSSSSSVRRWRSRGPSGLGASPLALGAMA